LSNNLFQPIPEGKYERKMQCTRVYGKKPLVPEKQERQKKRSYFDSYNCLPVTPMTLTSDVSDTPDMPMIFS